MKRLMIPLVVALLAAGAMAAREHTDPREAIHSFHTALLAATGQDSYQARFDRLEPLVERAFHITTMARIAPGRQWRSLTPTRQQRLKEAITELIASNYASRFKGGDHRFEIVSTRSLAANRLMVRCSLITVQGQLVDLDYQMVKDGNEWRIYDIVANGVSDLSMKRSAWAGSFADEGFEGVLATIRATIEENEP